ncbi:hypothetical protein PBT90_11175 [Algoriphagus halophytocola]|uniref:hypothetical protein n=1 Tax=Algoriphagus halophytocola TaxID=2991499 RepID=UPI0022DDC29F|nr:hypothetical protein [Algoriphagus sp. TR-M9]WBL41317.1 hypothetical protein PBT90_11175 [Algoriphagus sp. TR-M9]
MGAKKKHVDTVSEPSSQVYHAAAKPEVSRILEMARKLSNKEILQFTKKLELMLVKESQTSSTKFPQFLLSGPEMDDAHFKSFQLNRAVFNQWRKK